ncbi:MAG: glycine zipper domain-containing protein, partial [Desulfobacteraceae bacterium]
MKKTLILFLVLSLVLMSMGCAEWTRTQKGAVIGAGAGGALGALIGHKAGSTAVGVLLGAVIGGAAGAYIGNYMDKQAAEIERDIAGARVE